MVVVQRVMIQPPIGIGRGSSLIDGVGSLWYWRCSYFLLYRIWRYTLVVSVAYISCGIDGEGRLWSK